MFPGDAGGSVADMAQRSAELPSSANEDIMNEAARRGKDALKEAVERQLALESLQKDAFAAASQVVLKIMHAGGCVRDYSQLCPKDWKQAGDSSCMPPSFPSALCGRTDLSKFSADEKEAFAVQCKASWPCSMPCKADISGCPLDWSSAGPKMCVAPSAYAGICSPVLQNDGAKEQNQLSKSKLAAFCGFHWPCLSQPPGSGEEATASGPVNAAGDAIVGASAVSVEGAGGPPEQPRTLASVVTVTHGRSGPVDAASGAVLVA